MALLAASLGPRSVYVLGLRSSAWPRFEEKNPGALPMHANALPTQQETRTRALSRQSAAVPPHSSLYIRTTRPPECVLPCFSSRALRSPHRRGKGCPDSPQRRNAGCSSCQPASRAVKWPSSPAIKREYPTISGVLVQYPGLTRDGKYTLLATSIPPPPTAGPPAPIPFAASDRRHRMSNEQEGQE